MNRRGPDSDCRAIGSVAPVADFNVVTASRHVIAGVLAQAGVVGAEDVSEGLEMSRSVPAPPN
jgi:hypothetical protein